MKDLSPPRQLRSRNTLDAISKASGVAVAGEVEFESIMLVYYPGVRFFSMLLQSEFFQNIIGDRQLGDYQATVTVPVLDKL